MAARGHLRGHPIVFDEAADAWRFKDTGELTAETHHLRPCGHCGRADTPEGHDGCLGTLPGVMNACCGHGRPREAYVQYPDGSTVGGPLAVGLMVALVSARDHTDQA